MSDDPDIQGGAASASPPACCRVMLVFCTFPDLEKAREIGSAMVEGGLAACVNLLPGIESIYRWEGKIQRDGEVLGIFKVRADGFGTLEQALLEKHPYEVPEIVGIEADRVEERYAGWVGMGDRWD